MRKRTNNRENTFYVYLVEKVVYNHVIKKIENGVGKIYGFI